MSTTELYATLTPRELDVLCLMTQGKTNQQIADDLFISKESVRAVVRSINNKLGTPSMENSVAIRQATIDIALRHNLCNEVENATATVRNNLPHQTSTFIGRSDELSQLADILNNSSHRLVTIVAPGGMGKTRLSLTLAQRQLGQFSDGVFFVPLVAVTTEEGLINEIGTQIGLIFQGGNRTPKQQVLDALRDNNRLLVLDNFEQIITHAPVINDILAEASAVKIIVTSRERLGLKGERVFRLDGLNTETHDASQLFIDNLAKFDFEVAESDHEQIDHICQLVGGMPLALILASNWIEVLSLEEIADEIASNLDLLSEDMQDAPGIRAVFDRTWERLTDKQRIAFMKLSVCIGGITRESAKAIADANLITLKQLVDKSLIQQTDTGRYAMHELMRQYASEQLKQSGELQPTIDQYIAYFSDFVASREKQVKGAEQLQALDEIEVDFENIEAAWYLAIDHNQPDKMLHMLECLWFVADYRHHHFTVIDMLRYVLNIVEQNPHLDAATHRLCGLLIAYIISVEFEIGALKESDEEITKRLDFSIEIALQYGYKTDFAFCYLIRACIEIRVNYEAAIKLLEKSLNYYSQINDPCRSSYCYDLMCFCYASLRQRETVFELIRLGIDEVEKKPEYDCQRSNPICLWITFEQRWQI